MKKIFFYALVLFILPIHTSTFMLQHCAQAQMPGWLSVRDHDGNVFYLDPAMKLHPAKDPDAGYRIVKKENIGFLFSEADELERIRRLDDALRIWKSIRYLSSFDASIGISGGKATSKIRSVANREKDRFPARDLATALLLVRSGSVMRARNESAGYTVVSEGTVSVLSRKLSGSNGYLLDAAAFGVSSPDRSDGFDAVVTVSAERFRNSFSFIETYESLCRNRNSGDTFKREKISGAIDTILYRYEGGAPAVYAGYEKLCSYGSRCFLVRAFAPKDSPKGQETAKKLMDAIEIGKISD